MGLIAMNEQRMPVLSVSDGQSAIASSLERAWGLPRYARIIHRLGSVDVSVNAEYQKDFSRYFRSGAIRSGKGFFTRNSSG